MSMPKGYPWECDRDGANVKDVAENPTLGTTSRSNRMHKEWHDSETGRECEPPDYAQPTTPTRRK